MGYSFWGVIEQAKNASGEDWESRPESLKAILVKQNADDIIQFNKDYRTKLNESYRWDLWGAAYLINGGCSDDGFDYWRDFLISEGQSVFEAALSDPDSLAELDDIEDAELEEYRYAIDEAYEELTGDEIPDANVEYPADPEGEEWEENELNSMLPKLAEKYG
jgi:hypothetical protein